MMRKDIRLSIQDTKALPRAPTAGTSFYFGAFGRIGRPGRKDCLCDASCGAWHIQAVKVENLEEHKMHSEFYRIKEEDCDK